MDKASIRKHMIAKRERMPPSLVKSLSDKICLKILGMPIVKKSKSIGIYISVRNEVLAERMLGSPFGSAKKVFVPVVAHNGGMKFARLISLDKTSVGSYGIRVPTVKSFARNGAIGVFIVPGTAFDMRGFRLGWGKGYYDKFLSSNTKAVKIGVAYDFQIVDSIDASPHEVKMDFVVTEKRILKI